MEHGGAPALRIPVPRGLPKPPERGVARRWCLFPLRIQHKTTLCSFCVVRDPAKRRADAAIFGPSTNFNLCGTGKYLTSAPVCANVRPTKFKETDMLNKRTFANIYFYGFYSFMEKAVLDFAKIAEDPVR